MSDDIVKRLRENSDAHLAGRPFARRVTMAQLSEAADEIERLRERVKRREPMADRSQWVSGSVSGTRDLGPSD